MKVQILILCFLCCPSLLGCRTNSLAVANGNASSSQTSEYETVSLVTLALGKDIRLQATIETLKESKSAIANQETRSKLVIKNLSSGRLIYQEECGDSSLSNPGFWIDRGAALVMRSRGGSGDGIRVYEVGESEARLVLDEAYRAAAIVVPNDELGGDMGFLIVDAEHATDPLKVRRYQYSLEKKQFVLTGTANFSQFMRSVKAQFK